MLPPRDRRRPGALRLWPDLDDSSPEGGLASRGLELADVRHLLLSHIHLDHAGAAGVLVREHPGLQVHVSEIGAPHLVDPSKLDASARRLYGDAFDELWGELAPHPVRERPRRRRASRRSRVLPDARTRVPSRVVSRRERNALRGRRRRRSARRRAVRHAALPSAGARSRRLGERRSSRSSGARPLDSRSSTSARSTDVQEHLAALRETLGRWGERVEDGMDEASFIAAARPRRRADGSGARRRVPARRPVLAPLPRHRALLAQAPRGGGARAGSSGPAARAPGAARGSPGSGSGLGGTGIGIRERVRRRGIDSIRRHAKLMPARAHVETGTRRAACS